MSGPHNNKPFVGGRFISPNGDAFGATGFTAAAGHPVWSYNEFQLQVHAALMRGFKPADLLDTIAKICTQYEVAKLEISSETIARISLCARSLED
jgi:hypothetical protein